MINITWTQLKQIISSSGSFPQWFKDDNSYSVFDSTLNFMTTIPITTPESLDQIDFETNYKTSSSYSSRVSYSCATIVRPGTTPTDILTLTGSSTKTVRLSKVTVSGINVLSTSVTISLVIRSTTDSGGTYSNPISVAHDPNNEQATATITAYTANPTLGTPFGILRTANLEFADTGGNAVPLLVWDFSADPIHRPVLRGSSNQFCVNLNSQNVTAVHLAIEWTEEY